MRDLFDYVYDTKPLYTFKIKIAGDLTSDATSVIEDALKAYEVKSCALTKTTPVQQTCPDFPNLQNVSVALFDLVTEYPITTVVVCNTLSDALSIHKDNIRVRTDLQDADVEQLYNKETEASPILQRDYPKTNNQSVVGSKRLTGLLKELNKSKATGTQYKGVNDALLAKKAPKYTQD